LLIKKDGLCQLGWFNFFITFLNPMVVFLALIRNKIRKAAKMNYINIDTIFKVCFTRKLKH